MRDRRGWKLGLLVAWALSLAACGAPPRPRGTPAEVSRTDLDEELRAERRAVARAAYVKGVYLRERGDLPGAMERFTDAVRVFPEDAELRLARARLQLEMGHVREAGAFLESSIARFGGSAEEHLLLARLHVVAGRDTLALQRLDAAIGADSTLVAAWLLRGRVHYGDGRLEEALRCYERADALQPNRPATLTRLGDCHAQLGHDDAAEDAYRATLRLDPQLDAVRAKLAALYNRSGRSEAARGVYREVLESNPRDPEALDALLGLYIEADEMELAEQLLRPYLERDELGPRQQYVYGRILMALDRLAEADSALRPLRELEGLHGLEPLLGELALRQERFDEAREHFRRAIELEPDDCSAYVSLAFVMLNQLRGDGDRRPLEGPAADSLRSLLEAASAVTPADEYRCNVMLGITYSRLRDFDPAVRHLEAGRSVDPENTEILFSLAMAHQELGHFETALEYGRGVLELEPENPAALNFVGYILAERGLELQSSESLIRKALEVEPENGYYVDSLGWVFYQMGKYARAATELERAVELTENNDPIILEHLGDAYLKMGRLDGAYRAYVRSRSLDPDNSGLQQKIANLQERLGKP